MSTYTNYSKLEVDGTISSSVQGELIGTFTTMPKASALNEGKTIYYTGATSGNYVQNTFYTCVNNSGTYTWTSASPKQVSVDSALSATSTNPVQNKVITNALNGYAKKEDIASVYKAKGSIASANLPSSPSVGDVYDLTDASSYGPVGTNVVWNGTKWDALAGITDLSGKQDKLTAGTGISLGSNNTISLATSGVTAGTKGSATAVPVIAVDAYGRITSISTKTIFPPTSAGTSGQIWVSDGSGQGVWQSKDTTPTSGSTNAITSGAVYSELQKKQNNLTLDSAPTSGSSNPVTSGGVYTALAGKQATLTFDSAPKSASSNPVTSGGVYTALQAKQNKLTFDTTPTSGSNNPVTSGGIFSAINAKQDKLTFDSTPTEGSNNPVTSGGIFNAINSADSLELITGVYGSIEFDVDISNETLTPYKFQNKSSDYAYTIRAAPRGKLPVFDGESCTIKAIDSNVNYFAKSKYTSSDTYPYNGFYNNIPYNSNSSWHIMMNKCLRKLFGMKIDYSLYSGTSAYYANSQKYKYCTPFMLIKASLPGVTSNLVTINVFFNGTIYISWDDEGIITKVNNKEESYVGDIFTSDLKYVFVDGSTSLSMTGVSVHDYSQPLKFILCNKYSYTDTIYLNTKHSMMVGDKLNSYDVSNYNTEI